MELQKFHSVNRNREPQLGDFLREETGNVYRESLLLEIMFRKCFKKDTSQFWLRDNSEEGWQYLVPELNPESPLEVNKY